MPLIEYVASHLGSSKKKAKQLLDQRGVFVNDRRVWMARHELRRGDRVELVRPSAAPQGAQHTHEPAILFRAEQFLVAGKPAGELSNGPGSFEARLQRSLGIPALAAVHRLDRDTSGCLILAATSGAHARLVRLFKDHRVTKVYRAVARGQVPRAVERITAPVDGQPALTRMKVLDSNPVASYLALTIETGRTHQIRKHLASIRHPVVGDRVYDTEDQPVPALRAIPRQMLHAFSVSFLDPFTGAAVRVTAPLPADFRAGLHSLRLR